MNVLRNLLLLVAFLGLAAVAVWAQVRYRLEHAERIVEQLRYARCAKTAETLEFLEAIDDGALMKALRDAGFVLPEPPAGPHAIHFMPGTGRHRADLAEVS